MDPQLVRLLRPSLRTDGCLFLYGGRFPDEHSARLIELGEALDGLLEGVRNSKGRLAYMMVEAFQNIVRHRALAGDRGPGRSLFLLGCGGDGQRVTAQNAVTAEQGERLEELLGALHGKGPEGLKALFLERIQKASTPGARGAGLGLIEMVRRSGGQVSWAFSPLPGDMRLFSMSLDLGAGAAALRGAEAGWRSLALRTGLSLAYAGPWSAALGEVLLALAGLEGAAADRVRAAAADLPQGGPAFLLRQGGLVRLGRAAEGPGVRAVAV